MFCDNQVVVTSSLITHSLLREQHNTLADHCVSEMITAKIQGYYRNNEKKNPADIVRTHWS
jgi:hypothetical protein